MGDSETEKQFSMERFQLVLKRTIALNLRTWVIGFLSVVGFLLVMVLLPLMTGMSQETITGFTAVRGTAIFLYTVGGLILTSLLFNEVHTPNSAFQFLTLPATTLEKLVSAWFSGTVIYTVAAIASIVALSAIIETIQGLYTGLWSPFNLFNPASSDVLDSILQFFFYQSIFLLGAVYFRKNNFFKTLLVIIAISLGFFFFMSISMLIFGLSKNQEFFINIQMGSQPWVTYLSFTIGFILTLFFIWLSYLQLKNKQVV